MKEHQLPLFDPTGAERHRLELLAESRASDDLDERTTIMADLRETERLIAKHQDQQEALAGLPDFWVRVYGTTAGYLPLLSGQRSGKRLTDARRAFYPWPVEGRLAMDWIVREAAEGRELYQCAHLTTAPRRRKSDAAPLASLYVDLDHANLGTGVVVSPSVIVESSPGRRQCYWQLQAPVEPALGEGLNRRLAHALAADKTGWDLTQLLRVPGTLNHKYQDQPLVHVIGGTGHQYHLSQICDTLPDLPSIAGVGRPTMPLKGRATASPEQDLIPSNLSAPAQRIVNGEAVKLTDTGEVDRSAALVQIARVLHGAGMSRAEIVETLAERDVTLGWRKYADRDDAYEQYERIVRLIEGQR